MAALAVASTTEMVRLMRISNVEVIGRNYIPAATHGLSRWTIVRATY